MSRFLSVLLIAVLPVAHAPVVTSTRATLVTGTVLAANDSTMLPAVKVSAWSGGQVVGETTTDAHGRYELRLSIARPIDAIYYEYPGWPTQHIQHLSGSRDHVINKLLQPTTSQLPLLPALAALAAYESLYFISDRGERLDVETRHRAREVLRRLEVPEDIAPRLRQVQSLWAIG